MADAAGRRLRRVSLATKVLNSGDTAGIQIAVEVICPVIVIEEDGGAYATAVRANADTAFYVDSGARPSLFANAPQTVTVSAGDRVLRTFVPAAQPAGGGDERDLGIHVIWAFRSITRSSCYASSLSDLGPANARGSDVAPV